MNDELNGIQSMPEGIAPGVDPMLVKFAEEFLQQVKAGQVVTAGIALVTAQYQPSASFYGPRGGDLNNAVDILKWRLMCAFLNVPYGADGPKRPAPVGRIIRAGMPG